MGLLKDFNSQVIGNFKKTFVPKKQVTVEMIHKEFMSAGDKALEEAKTTLATVSKEKGEKLKALGFTQAKEIDSVQVVEIAEDLKNKILEYSVKYPLCRFIADESIGTICKKYNLVYGPIARYKGFVPLEKLQAIERFKETCKIPRTARFTPYGGGKPYILSIEELEETKDNAYYLLTLNGKHCFQQVVANYDGIHYYGSSPELTNGDGGRIEILALQICAPLADMDTTGMTLDKHTLKLAPKDPVVIQPIPGGGLIIAAWGDEASDPLVLNEKHN